MLPNNIYSQYIDNTNDSHFRNNVHDPFDWMEMDESWLNNWLSKQAASARSILDNLPWRKGILRKIESIGEAETYVGNFVKRDDRLFFIRSDAQFPYRRLFVTIGNSPEKLVITPPPNKRLGYFSLSPDGRYVAYGLSQYGSEIFTVHVREVDTGKDFPVAISRVRHTYIPWQKDNRSFFYTRLPEDAEKEPASTLLAGQQTFLYRFGEDPDKAEPIFGPGVEATPEIGPNSYPRVAASPSSSWVIGIVDRGTKGENLTLYAVRANQLNGIHTPWKKIIEPGDGVADFILHDDDLYLMSNKNSPRFSILRRAVDDTGLKSATTVFPQGESVIVSIAATKSALYVNSRDVVADQLIRIPFDDNKQTTRVPLPFSGSVGPIFSDEMHDGILFRILGWTQPPELASYDPSTGIVVDTGMIPRSPADFSSFIAEQKYAVSSDGTLVPLTIIRRRDMLFDGTHPTWLTGYGAYATSQSPTFLPERLVWLEQGGILAIAHVRGGGELGAEWHQAGKGPQKINSIEDFIACAQFLVNQKYTRPDRLAAVGESAGGILVGGAIVRRPDLFAAVVIKVGILNALRLEETPIGFSNVPEFGSASTPDGFQNLLTIDAYHNLQDGVRYPAVLLTVGMNDIRVPPWQSGKFAARLQEIGAHIDHGNPVLVRVDEYGGHDTATDGQFADIQSFLLWQTLHRDYIPGSVERSH